MNVVVLIFAFASVVTTTNAACPEPCQCNTTTHTIDCSNRNLVAVPEFRNVALAANINLLDLSRNNLTVLNSTDFQYFLGFTIQVIDVSFNQIQEVIGVEFRNGNESMIGYRTLNLSHNLLTSFPENIVPNNNIKVELVIDISHNALQYLPANIFTEAGDNGPGFQLLANNNRLKSIHPDAFTGLVVIDLRNNSLEYLPLELKLSEYVRTIKMAGNPWRCDCRFRWILGTRYRNLSATSPPLCDAPEVVRGRPLFGLRNDEFACAPLSDETAEVLIDKGDYQRLVCPVTSDPPNHDVTWNIIYLDGTKTPFSIEVQSASLKLTNLKSNDVLYQCTATNIAGSVTIDLQVNVTRNEEDITPVMSTSAVTDSTVTVTRSTISVTGSSSNYSNNTNSSVGNFTSLTDITSSSAAPPKRTIGVTSPNDEDNVEVFRSTFSAVDDLTLFTDLFEDVTTYDATLLRNQTSTVYWVNDKSNSASNICVSYSSFVVFLICLSVAAFAILVTLLCSAIFCCHFMSGQKQRKMDIEKRTKACNEYAFDGPVVYAEDAEVAVTGNYHFTETSTPL